MDIVAVQNLLSSYCQLLDGNDEAAFVALFGSSPKLVVGDETIDSVDALKAFFQRVRSRSSANSQHWEGNVLLGRANNFFTNYSYWQFIKDGKIASMGTHEDLIKVRLFRASRHPSSRLDSTRLDFLFSHSFVFHFAVGWKW